MHWVAATDFKDTVYWPCTKLYLVATHGIAVKNPPAAQKAFSPWTTTVEKMSVI